MTHPDPLQAPPPTSSGGDHTGGSWLGRIRRALLRCRRGRSADGPGPDRRDMVQFSEVNYFALARVLIDQHGKDAKAQAARLQEEAVREADPEAADDWHAVGHAIALLADDAAATRH